MSTTIAIGASTLLLPALGENYDVTIINNNNTAIANEVNNTNKFAKGIAAAPKKQTANGVGLNALSVIENIASFAFKANRKYRIVWHGGFSISVASDYFDLAINTASTADLAGATTGLTKLNSRSYTANNINLGEPFYMEAVYEPGADTTLQLKATVVRTVGTGNWTLQAAATAPMYFYVEDLGAQY